LESPEIGPIVDNFWRANYDEDDLAMHNRFLEILRLSKDGLNGEEIGKTLRMNNVRAYLSGRKKSFFTHLRVELDRLGPPEFNSQYLPLHLKPRGTPGDAWIRVPTLPMTYEILDDFVHRLTPMQANDETLRDFGFSSTHELERERTNLFGHLLGSVVGDFGKGLRATTKFPSMRLSLVLSTNKPNSFRFGTFSTFCANASLGLGMHNLKNLPISDGRYGKSECFLWNSPTSPLVAWIFYDCLGLRPGETTTRNPVRMDWLLKAPYEFGAHFIQGLAESDGWPDAGADKAIVVSSPNTQLFRALLENLGCPSRIDYQKVELLVCDTENAFKLPFFSPRIQSNLYEDLKTLAKAMRYPERKRLPQSTIDLIREFAKTTTEASQICLRLAKTIGYKVSGQTIRKYMES
jgi:hypothetical protein